MLYRLDNGPDEMENKINPKENVTNTFSHLGFCRTRE